MSVADFHPLKGSEDDVPRMSDSQRDTLRRFADEHDEVSWRVRLDGTLHVETVDYEDNGYTETCHVVYRDGLVF